jgi:phage protein U
MATAGIFGSFLFGKSFGSFQSFYEVDRSEATRWEDHDVLLQKPRSEYIGPDLIEVSIKLHLNAEWSGRLSPIIAHLKGMQRAAIAACLLLGGQAQGPGASFFVLREMHEAYSMWLPDGSPVICDLDLSFVEYSATLNLV